ncbi:Alpha-xylosidase [Minicystis rosea]|nr:Alpha-xylosidase [Minicystis rosea]
MRLHSSLPVLLAITCAFAACSSKSETTPDGGASGGGTPDSGVPDSGTPDASLPCAPDGGPPAPIPVPAIHTPRWAFEPWISKDISTGADTYDFVKGFEDRDIPVGAVVLDSPWETFYNTFLPNPSRYPDFPKMVSDMHAKNVRVVLWVTAMVNSFSYDLEPGGDSYTGPAPNLAEGETCQFFVNDAEEYQWWKGKGSSLDFFNPNATAWWHAQQETVMAAGIDGWKLDFGESYITAESIQTAAGTKTLQEYSEEYYKDFLAYGVSRRGKDFTTMVRSWDESYGFAGRFFARPEHAPVCWMGDNRRDWVGIADALDEMMRSAKAGYVVLGSDIGGYLDHDDKDLLGPQIPLDPVVFARWTALGGLSPFMQLHGRANLTPWTFPDMPDQVTAVYRYWSKLHHSMVPFLYSAAEEAYAQKGPMMHPIGDQSAWAGDYRYMLGDAFLVAPILDATGKRDVALPAGRWFDWWAPGADGINGGQTLAAYDSTDLNRIPLFVKAGAIVPMEVSDDVNGIGTKASAGKLTVLVYPDATQTTFKLHEEDDSVTTIDTKSTSTGFSVTLSTAVRDTLLRVRADSAPTAVQVDGKAAPALADRAAFDAATEGWFYEATTRSAWVHVTKGTGMRVVTSG